MLPYFATLIVASVLASTAEKAKPLFDSESGQLLKGSRKSYRQFVVLTAFVLILVSGLRYQVGTDYGAYSRGYIRLAESVWNDIRSFSEPGLGIIAFFCRLISDDYVVMFFAAAAVTVTLYLIAISKYSSSFLFGMLLYLLVGSWHNSFNAVRQYLAAAVIFAGHRYLLDRKFFKYLVIIFIAMFFHRTALIMLPVYFLVGHRFTFKNAILILAATVILRLSYDYLFNIMSFLKGSDQTQYDYMNTEVNIFRILVTIPPVFLVFLMPKEKRENPENSLYMSLLVVNAGFMIAMSESAYLARVGVYTETYAAIAIPNFVREFSPRNRKITIFFVIILYFIYWFYEISTRSSLSPFRWIFSR